LPGFYCTRCATPWQLSKKQRPTIAFNTQQFDFILFFSAQKFMTRIIPPKRCDTTTSTRASLDATYLLQATSGTTDMWQKCRATNHFTLSRQEYRKDTAPEQRAPARHPLQAVKKKKRGTRRSRARTSGMSFAQ
jgi:hypothetical protein